MKAKPKISDVRKHYTQASRIAEKLVILHARKILREHPNLDEFVNAMGRTLFTDKTGNNLGLTDRRYFEPLARIYSEWDGVLKLSGAAMRFRAKGKIVFAWW